MISRPGHEWTDHEATAPAKSNHIDFANLIYIISEAGKAALAFCFGRKILTSN